MHDGRFQQRILQSRLFQIAHHRVAFTLFASVKVGFRGSALHDVQPLTRRELFRPFGGALIRCLLRWVPRSESRGGGSLRTKVKVNRMNEDINGIIRSACLRGAQQWERPTREEIQEVIRRTGMSGRAVARALGIGEEGRHVRRWCTGKSEIPYTAWAVLCHLAGLGIIWRVEPEAVS